MGVLIEVAFWSSVFLGTGALLFCSVYSLILYADLSVDYINPIQLCDHINRTILPEYAGHMVLTLLILARGFIIAAALNIPLVIYHLHRYSERRHLLESTSIFNQLDKERSISQRKLAFHLVLFFVYLYFFVVTLIAD